MWGWDGMGRERFIRRRRKEANFESERVSGASDA